MYDITASIVLYKNDPKEVEKAIESFLDTDLNVKLYLIDNSPTDELKELKNIDKNRIEYIFSNANLGFGKAHNIAIKKAINESKYHLVLNPDIWFEKGNLEKMYEFMEKHPEIGQLMPKVLNPDGSIQYLCKRLPTPFDLFVRRFIPPFLKPVFQKRMDWYEFKDVGYDKTMEVPALSGCFMFLRTEALKQVGGFDERFFMYMEDYDLCRRIGQKYKTVYYPEAQVYHGYAKHSYKNKKLLLIHIESAIKYFNKWGWFFDRERREKNKIVRFLQ